MLLVTWWACDFLCRYLLAALIQLQRTSDLRKKPAQRSNPGTEAKGTVVSFSRPYLR